MIPPFHEFPVWIAKCCTCQQPKNKSKVAGWKLQIKLIGKQRPQLQREYQGKEEIRFICNRRTLALEGARETIQGRDLILQMKMKCRLR